MLNISSIKSLLQSHNLFAKKHLGQNFLINEHVLQKIVQTAELTEEDEVIEIGPGLGTLTIELAKRVKHITAIEKDHSLIPILEKTMKQFNNLTILHQNALDFQPPPHPYKLVANIPYYITSPLINHFLKEQFMKSEQKYAKVSKSEQKNADPNSTKSTYGIVPPVYRGDKMGVEGTPQTSGHPPTLIVLLTQKEVAQKICAKPPDMNVLALNIQTFANVKIIDYVSKNSFYPAPKVDSAIIKLTPYDQPLIDCDLNLYFRLISAGFSQKRKKLHNSLSAGLHLKSEETKKLLDQAGIDGNRRAETLEIKEWQNLTNIFSTKNELST